MNNNIININEATMVCPYCGEVVKVTDTVVFEGVRICGWCKNIELLAQEEESRKDYEAMAYAY